MARKTTHINVKAPMFPFGQEYLPDNTQPSVEEKSSPESNISVVDMRNVLPTTYGQTSFFGNVPIGDMELPPATEHIFTYRDSLGNNTLLALGKYGAMYSNDGVTWNYDEVATKSYTVGVITGITAANPGVVTDVAHGLTTGDRIKLTSILGMVELNQQTATVTVLTADTFSIGIDTTAYTAYASGGAWVKLDTVANQLKYVPDMSVEFYSYAAVRSTLTTAAPLAGLTLTAIATQALVTGATQTAVTLPITAGNAHYAAVSVAMDYDEALEFDKLRCYVDPGISAAVAGEIYIMQMDECYGYYTVKVNDTVSSLLLGLVAAFNEFSITYARGYTAEVLSDSKVKVTSANTADVFMPAFRIYEWVTPADSATIMTLTEDQLEVAIPGGSQGNIGYVVFEHALDITDGSYLIWHDGYRNSGWLAGMAEGNTTLAKGQMTAAQINALGTTKVLIPLVGDKLFFERIGGTVQGITATIHDTGVAINSTVIGARTNYNVCDCNLVAADVITGRKFILQSDGQVGVYTALAADTPYDVVAGVVAAYDAAGAANATQYGEQIVVTSSLDELHFMPCSLATMTTEASATEVTRVEVFDVRFDTFAAADTDQMFELVITNSVAPSNVTFQIRVDGRPVPVVSDVGNFTDANYSFTAAQLIAAIGAGTRLMVPVRGRYLTVHTTDLGAGTVGDSDFSWFKITANGASTSLHCSDVAGLVKANSVVPAAYQNYLVKGTPEQLNSLGNTLVTDAAAVSSVFAVHKESRVATIAPSIIVPGVAVTDVVTEAYHSVPVDINGIMQGSIQVGTAGDAYTPGSIDVDYLDPVTLIEANAVSAGVFTSGRRSMSGTAVGLSAADLLVVNVLNPWTMAIIKNRLYCYRKELNNLLLLAVDSSAWERPVPTTINMAEIEGICEARGRMAAWDSTNSVYRGSNVTPTDFTPAISTGANVSKIDAVKGNIVLMLPIKDGYVIYATASIILATYIGGTQIFSYAALDSSQGILNTKAVVVADDKTHFVNTVEGLFLLTSGGMQAISPEADEYLKASKVSPRLDYIQGRYLTLSLFPETAGWATQKIEYYSGATIPGFAGLPSDPGRNVSLVVDNSWFVDITVKIPIQHAKASQLFTFGNHGNVTYTTPVVTIQTLGDLQDWYNSGLQAFVDTVSAPPVGETPSQVAIWGLPSLLFAGLYSDGIWYQIAATATETLVAATPTFTNVTIRVTQKNFAQVVAWVTGLDLMGARVDNVFSRTTRVPAGSDVMRIESFVPAVIMAIAKWQGVDTPLAEVYAYQKNWLYRPDGFYYYNGDGTYVDYPYGLPSVLTALGVLSGGSMDVALQSVYVPIYDELPFSGLSAIPDFVIPDGNFIAASGVLESPDPIYSRSLILDTSLKNWGSCDTEFRNLIDFVPVNARSTNPITDVTSTKFTYQNLAASLAIMLKDGSLNICTQQITDSFIEFGNYGLTQSGTTTFLDAVASFAAETGATIEVLGSRNGEQLNSLFTVSAISVNGAAAVNSVLTCKWFRLRVSGRYNLKALEISGQRGGNR